MVAVDTRNKSEYDGVGVAGIKSHLPVVHALTSSAQQPVMLGFIPSIHQRKILNISPAP
jgi:hypothetical protein